MRANEVFRDKVDRTFKAASKNLVETQMVKRGQTGFEEPVSQSLNMMATRSLLIPGNGSSGAFLGCSGVLSPG